MLISSAAKMRFQSETYWPTKPAIATGMVCWALPLRYSSGVKKSFQIADRVEHQSGHGDRLEHREHDVAGRPASGVQPSISAASSKSRGSARRNPM